MLTIYSYSHADSRQCMEYELNPSFLVRSHGGKKVVGTKSNDSRPLSLSMRGLGGS